MAAGVIWLGWGVLSEDEATLKRIGDFLWVRQEPQRADLIYVLGGDYITRVPFAASLYAEGWAPKVVIPRERMSPNDFGAQGGPEHFTDASLRILREKGVPSSALLEWTVRGGVQSTADEMRALAIYSDTFPDVTRVLVVTSQYHTRRVAYAAGRMLPGRVECIVLGTPSSEGSIEEWWKHPGTRQTVIDEYWKLLYYVPRYLLG
jgi:uncharacterized SAM-binding protein YcdF (DUF218 family)